MKSITQLLSRAALGATLVGTAPTPAKADEPSVVARVQVDTDGHDLRNQDSYCTRITRIPAKDEQKHWVTVMFGNAQCPAPDTPLAPEVKATVSGAKDPLTITVAPYLVTDVVDPKHCNAIRSELLHEAEVNNALATPPRPSTYTDRDLGTAARTALGFIKHHVPGCESLR